MALFKKKKKEVEEKTPSLPEPPRLPEIPQSGSPKMRTASRPPKLPSYPVNSLGDKFSQDTIKDAVSGKRGDLDEEDDFADERRIPHPSQQPLKPRTKEANTDPVFIRIDKFEQGMKIFEKAKNQISEMGKMLAEIKQIKDEENKELQKWEKEIQSIKKQIEKIDNDVFSRI